MNHRERIHAAVRFEAPDRLPTSESFWDGTIDQWKTEGMPEVDPVDFFDFDLCHMWLDASPRFEQKILQRADRMITYEDRFGYTVRKQDGHAGSMEFSNHVTTDREAWERIKPRFALSTDPAEPARIDDASYFAHFAPYPTWDEAVGKYQRLRATDRYMLFGLYGPWEAAWRHRGLDKLLLDVALDPDWLRDMADTYVELVLAILGRCLELGMKPDGVYIIEDLGSTRSLLFSPASWRATVGPAFGRLGEFLGRHGMHYWMHSCGAIQPIVDDLVERGLNVLNPLQVAAGMDAVKLRERYGKRLAFFGNIDVHKMTGPIEPLDAELRRNVPLARAGGYIFQSDHSVPPTVTFERYCWLLNRARELFEISL
ncbi:MAG TPA: uroporphyrinogen decarboxylase family protein [Thermoguttaceae bacterium]|nr:uroporphyrinogen decarboxylase family protein [Thermoguttaceae bacterium]